MKTDIERLDDNKVKFDITIDAADVDAAIDDVYREVRKNARIPGFRKGKAPRTVLEHNFGAEYFTSMATANLIEDRSPKAVDDADMIALKDYDYDADETVVPGTDYTYSFTIVVKPELTLSSTDPVEVKVPSPEATEDEIESQINVLRSYYIDLKQVDDRPVQDDDIVAFSQKDVKSNGEPVEGADQERRTYVVGSGISDKDLDEQLIGMSIGDSKEVSASKSAFGVEGDYEEPLTATVEIIEITEKAMPELTDEWCKANCGVDTVDELRKQVADSISAEKTSNLERDKSIACLDALTERLEGEIPNEVKEEATTTALRNLYVSLQREGYTLDQYLMATQQSADKFYKDMEEQGELLAKQDMALDALARALELEITDEDIDEAFADAEADDPAALRKEWEDSHRMAVLREQILRDKAAKWLYDNAKVEYTKEKPKKEEPEEDAEKGEASEADSDADAPVEAEEVSETDAPAEEVEAEAETADADGDDKEEA